MADATKKNNSQKGNPSDSQNNKNQIEMTIMSFFESTDSTAAIKGDFNYEEYYKEKTTKIDEIFTLLEDDKSEGRVTKLDNLSGMMERYGRISTTNRNIYILFVAKFLKFVKNKSIHGTYGEYIENIAKYFPSMPLSKPSRSNYALYASIKNLGKYIHLSHTPILEAYRVAKKYFGNSEDPIKDLYAHDSKKVSDGLLDREELKELEKRLEKEFHKGTHSGEKKRRGRKPKPIQPKENLKPGVPAKGGAETPDDQGKQPPKPVDDDVKDGKVEPPKPNGQLNNSELLSLKWTDVDYKKKLIHIFARKTKTDRWVPLSDEFIKKLRQHQDQSNSEYIISFRGKQVKNMHKAFREACKRAGITYEVRMYDIRHRFASELFSNNVSVGVVSRLVGHSRISTTTDVYLEVLPKEIFEIRNKLPSLDLPVAENQ